MSVFARWKLPESGLELYMEWARTDHALNAKDLVLEPEHSRGKTLGLRKLITKSASRITVLGIEATTLEATPTFQLRPRPTFYDHSVVTEGYTHRGQVLGAPIGPGGSAQSITIDRYTEQGSVGLLLERRIADNDAFWVWAVANDRTFDRHNGFLSARVRTLRFVGRWELGGSAMITREYNRHFYGREGWNFNVQASARIRFAGR